MTRARIASAVALAYLALVAAGAVWFEHTRGKPTWQQMLLCAAPFTLALIVVLRREPDLRQALAKLFACFLGLPILLAMWVFSQDFEPEPSPVTTVLPAQLDVQSVFAGAVSVQDVPLSNTQITLLRSGVFADGTALRLTRFSAQNEASRYLDMLRQSGAYQDGALGPRKGLLLGQNGATEGEIAFIEQHGHELLEVRGRDRAALLSRLDTQQVKIPPAMIDPARAEATPQKETPVWPFGVGFGFIHALCVVAFVFWAGAYTTRVPRAEAQSVAHGTLEARLRSLTTCGVPCTITRNEQGDLVIDYRFPEAVKRAHRVTLRIDPKTSTVHVREHVGASGDSPRTNAEADMRGPGEPAFDPTRPKAQQVWFRSVATTILEPEKMKTVPLSCANENVDLPTDYAARLDPDGLVYVLCAVVTQSGFTWQPVFFWSQA